METIKVRNLTKKIKKREIIKDISFEISEGEIVGLVGPNGAGKTTTMKLITQLLFPDAGTIEVCGYDLKENREDALSNLSAIVETPALYEQLSGKANVEFFRKIRKVSKQKADEMIETMGLSDRIGDKVKKYSLGMKQRLALIICLLSEPKLLILDEPTNGLDPSGTIELRNLIIEQAREKNMSVLISSHILDELEKMCDRIIFIKDGEIVSSQEGEQRGSVQIIKMQIQEADRAEAVLRTCTYIRQFQFDGNELIVSIEKDRLNDLLKCFVTEDIAFSGLDVQKGLESEYITLFGGE